VTKGIDEALCESRLVDPNKNYHIILYLILI